jgi:hypothetical protein
MNPHIKDGALIIPHDSDSKYHYWNGGQRLTETLGELDAPTSLFKNHAYYKDRYTGEMCGCGKPAKASTEVFYCAPCGAWWMKP